MVRGEMSVVYTCGWVGVSVCGGGGGGGDGVCVCVCVCVWVGVLRPFWQSMHDLQGLVRQDTD